MALITWSDSLSVGVKEFDQQHQKLIGMVNELHDAMKTGKGTDMLGRTLSGLVTYTAQHFAAEEKLMSQHGYPEFPLHQGEHKKLVDQVKKLQADLASGKSVLTLEVMTFLKDWLSKHIQGTDKKYGPFFNQKGVK